MLKSELKAALQPLIDAGNLADAIILAVTTPIEADPPVAVGDVTADGSRDETKDSVDPVTGTLTDDATAKRAADKAADDVAEAELEVDAAEEKGDEDALAAAKDKLAAAQARKEATAAALAADDAVVEAPATPLGESDPVDASNDPAPAAPGADAPLADPGAVTTAEDLQS